jgi:BirA family biotin operon repressor/biotin-[acetyl-CoA-carboxylase] ligase
VPEPLAIPPEGPAAFTDVRWFAELDSTNRYLVDEARAGAPAGVVAVADHQTAGRGRLGRTWVAPPGASLLTSVLLRPRLPVEQRHLLVTAAGLAMAEAIEATTGVVAGMKWPNDLLVDDRKLCGVLAEAAADALVVGLGVNVEWTDVPAELTEIATACNLEGGRPVDRRDLLDAFLAVYVQRLADLNGARRDYEARLVTLGRHVRVEQAHRTLVGVARGIDDAGRLLVAPDGGDVEAVAVGDVVHVRPTV